MTSTETKNTSNVSFTGMNMHERSIIFQWSVRIIHSTYYTKYKTQTTHLSRETLALKKQSHNHCMQCTWTWPSYDCVMVVPEKCQ